MLYFAVVYLHFMFLQYMWTPERTCPANLKYTMDNSTVNKPFGFQRRHGNQMYRNDFLAAITSTMVWLANQGFTFPIMSHVFKQLY